VKCAIFKESDKTLLGTTQEVAVPAGFTGWQTFSLASLPFLTSGASYSLVVWFGGSNCFIYYSGSSSTQSWYATQAYGIFPNGPYSSFSGYAQENNVYSLYVSISNPNLNGGNLAAIPDDWSLTYKTGPQIISLDYNVQRTAGQPSIRLDPHTAGDLNVAREVNANWHSVNAGDHVVASCWMKVQTGPSTTGYPFCGARIGIDFYGYVNGVFSLLSADSFWNAYYGTDYSSGFAMYVQDSNGGQWQQRTIDIIVPTTAADSYGNVGTITQIVLWLQGAPWAGSAASTVWFADSTLYINP
jgi:hypothetical protein